MQDFFSEKVRFLSYIGKNKQNKKRSKKEIKVKNLNFRSKTVDSKSTKKVNSKDTVQTGINEESKFLKIYKN